MLGIKQNALAWELGENWNQQKVSLIEQKESIEENLLRDDIVKKRETEWKDYESAKKRQQKRLELEALMKARENNEIDLKNYLSRKKEISEIIDSYDFYLRETRFSDW